MLGKVRIIHAGGYDSTGSAARLAVRLLLDGVIRDLEDEAEGWIAEAERGRDLREIMEEMLQVASMVLDPPPSPMATSPASPLAPTSPDGAGASCGPLASSTPGCKVCGSPRLRQSDTSDHPGVVRCDACGLVQCA